MREKFPSALKNMKCAFILCICCCFCTGVCISDEANDVALQEARVARETAERRCVQLEMELEKSKASLDKMRSRYADLYLRSHGLLKSLRQTELQVANLWHNKDDSSLAQLSSRLLEALEAAGSRQLKVSEALDRYEKSLNAVMEVLQPGEAVRQELAEQLGKLRQAVEVSLKPMTPYTEKSEGDIRKGCGVVAVDKELEMVLLDRGSLGGMPSESRWCMTREGKILAKFVVVDVRLELSAAVLIDGSLTEVPVGSHLVPVEHAR